MNTAELRSATLTLVAGAVIGAGALYWGFGFNSPGQVREKVAAAVTATRVADLAPACVAAVKASPDFAKLKGASSWERSGLIEKAGFANIPGTNNADSDVARACSGGLS